MSNIVYFYFKKFDSLKSSLQIIPPVISHMCVQPVYFINLEFPVGQATRHSYTDPSLFSHCSSSHISSPFLPYFQETLGTLCLLCLECCWPINTPNYSPRPLQDVGSFKPFTDSTLSPSPLPSVCHITFCSDCGIAFIKLY